MDKKTKPLKKDDQALYALIEEKISDLDVLAILEGVEKRGRKRNKSKDKYSENFDDWNYCIEGIGIDHEEIRIIVSFAKNFLLIITIIRIGLD